MEIIAYRWVKYLLFKYILFQEIPLIHSENVFQFTQQKKKKKWVKKIIRMRTPCKFTLICEWKQQQNASLALLLRLILTPLLLLLRWVRPLCCTNKFSDDSHGIQSRWIAWKDTHEKNTKQNKVFLFLNAIIFTWEAI